MKIEKNNCKFCGKDMSFRMNMYYPMTLINESLEKQKVKYNHDWDRMEAEMSEEDFQSIMFYDQLISTVGKCHICDDCLEKDDELYEKYYASKREKFILAFCPKCTQMTNHIDGVCQKCKSNNYIDDLPF